MRNRNSDSMSLTLLSPQQSSEGGPYTFERFVQWAIEEGVDHTAPWFSDWARFGYEQHCKGLIVPSPPNEQSSTVQTASQDVQNQQLHTLQDLVQYYEGQGADTSTNEFQQHVQLEYQNYIESQRHAQYVRGTGWLGTNDHRASVLPFVSTGLILLSAG